MSDCTFLRCWLHMLWGTKSRQRVLGPEQAKRVWGFLHKYSESHGIHLRTCYVNPDHVHILIGIPLDKYIPEVAKLLKGASSYWVNEKALTPQRFAWCRGFGAFTVSHSQAGVVDRYIRNQEEHHRRRTFEEEVRLFLERNEIDLSAADDLLGEEEEEYELEYPDAMDVDA